MVPCTGTPSQSHEKGSSKQARVSPSRRVSASGLSSKMSSIPSTSATTPRTACSPRPSSTLRINPANTGRCPVLNHSSMAPCARRPRTRPRPSPCRRVAARRLLQLQGCHGGAGAQGNHRRPSHQRSHEVLFLVLRRVPAPTRARPCERWRRGPRGWVNGPPLLPGPHRGHCERSQAIRHPVPNRSPVMYSASAALVAAT